MDLEAIVWLLFIVVWVISSVFQQFKRMAQNRPGQGPPGPPEPGVPGEPGSYGPITVENARSRPLAREDMQRPLEREDLERPMDTAPPPPRPPETLDEAVRSLMRQMGLEREEPVASEHRPTASEQRPTASEHRPTAAERSVTASEHRATPSEARRTASEHRRVAAEHRRTASEHRKGDASLPPIPRSAPAGLGGARGGTIARAVRRDLASGRRTVAEALALREILGPPVALRPYDAKGIGEP